MKNTVVIVGNHSAMNAKIFIKTLRSLADKKDKIYAHLKPVTDALETKLKALKEEQDKALTEIPEGDGRTVKKELDRRKPIELTFNIVNETEQVKFVFIGGNPFDDDNAFNRAVSKDDGGADFALAAGQLMKASTDALEDKDCSAIVYEVDWNLLCSGTTICSMAGVAENIAAHPNFSSKQNVILGVLGTGSIPAVTEAEKTRIEAGTKLVKKHIVSYGEHKPQADDHIVLKSTKVEDNLEFAIKAINDTLKDTLKAVAIEKTNTAYGALAHTKVPEAIAKITKFGMPLEQLTDEQKIANKKNSPLLLARGLKGLQLEPGTDKANASLSPQVDETPSPGFLTPKPLEPGTSTPPSASVQKTKSDPQVVTENKESGSSAAGYKRYSSLFATTPEGGNEQLAPAPKDRKLGPGNTNS